VGEAFVHFFAQDNWRPKVIGIGYHDLKGRVVLATEFIPSGVVVCSSRIRGLAPERDMYSLQKEENVHLYIDEPGQIFSHSCDPNLAVRDNEYGAFDFVTVRPVVEGEELSFHYGMSEAESVAVAACCCGSAKCQGRSVGFRELTDEQQAELVRLGVSDFLRRWYEGTPRPVLAQGYQPYGVLQAQM